MNEKPSSSQDKRFRVLLKEFQFLKEGIAEHFGNQRAYLVVIATKLAALEAKLDMIQKSISDDDEAANFKFLDPQRKRLEELLTKKYTDDIDVDISGLLSLIDAGRKPKKKSNRRT